MAKLYVVPTPVGNLEDMTLRAVRVLRESDYIVAEDTRTSGNLLRHLEISKPMSSYHKFNEHGVVEQIVARMLGGQTVALVSDAGTPAISDPGYLLVSHAIAAGIDVETLPGPTAFVPALVDSGLPCDRFVFEGFLPPKKGRQSRLQQLAAEPRTMIFYESPHRAGKTLAQFAELFGGERRAALCREISKKFEETVRGTLAELAARYADKEPKGEIVLIVEGAREAAKKTRGGTSADEDE
ncbi:16S rRNA (cytidine(1402)-2'-O)-methyltransferase [Rikenella microfusus]|uniref:16S rRNA (cytidine(1402)-2'-O)-methyltransferase n=1 Tax=Rikenella microfusus TaxID=28139 RepID=UPI001DF2D39E|nr:16S rRNA (cytidine(1402)-2'-O)-methyltransferase [Rikenella microfusus]HJE89081.1 16S rRNA (cytidine(1402)-2'-O)-methyltransferase [Rikenella microfusus]